MKIHNKFEFVVTDIATGESKQVAKAENIVLDRYYSEALSLIASTSTSTTRLYDGISVGRGTGTLDPSRTTLFDLIGRRAITVEEFVIGVPMSYRTVKINIPANTYVGETITEVGLAGPGTSSNVVTHALLKDSEGNPISLVKTDTMVVDIYATLYVEVPLPEEIAPHEISQSGGLFRFYIGDSSNGDRDTFRRRVTLRTAANNRDHDSRNIVSSNGILTMPDIGGLSESTFNDDFLGIRSLSWLGYTFSLSDPNIWPGVTIKREIGIGDGVEKMYQIPYVWNNSAYIGPLRFFDLSEEKHTESTGSNDSFFIDEVTYRTPGGSGNTAGEFDLTDKDYYIAIYGPITKASNSTTYPTSLDIFLEILEDGVWKEFLKSTRRTHGAVNTNYFMLLNKGYKYRVRITSSGHSTHAQRYSIGITQRKSYRRPVSPNPYVITVDGVVQTVDLIPFFRSMHVNALNLYAYFDAPPPEGSKIEAEVECKDGIPKNSDNIFRGGSIAIDFNRPD